MPAARRTALPAPSQATRYCERTVTGAPASSRPAAMVDVTPSASWTPPSQEVPYLTWVRPRSWTALASSGSKRNWGHLRKISGLSGAGARSLVEGR